MKKKKSKIEVVGNPQIDILNREIEFLLKAGDAKDNYIYKIILSGDKMAEDYAEKVSGNNSIINQWKNVTNFFDE